MMNVPPKCDLLLIGFWDTPAVDNRGPQWQTTPHTSVSHRHTHTSPSLFSFFLLPTFSLIISLCKSL